MDEVWCGMRRPDLGYDLALALLHTFLDSVSYLQSLVSPLSAELLQGLPGQDLFLLHASRPVLTM